MRSSATIDTGKPSLHGIVAAARGDRQGPIVLVRGFDSGSRALRDRLRTVTRALEVELVDITPARRLGRYPEPRDVALVVAARESVLPAAQRFAARWSSRVLRSDALAGGELAVQYLPTVTVRHGGGSELTVVSRLSLSGPVRHGGGNAGELTVRPGASGMVVDFGDATRQLAQALTVELGSDGVGVVDGEQRPFTAGVYDIMASGRPLPVVTAAPPG